MKIFNLSIITTIKTSINAQKIFLFDIFCDFVGKKRRRKYFTFFFQIMLGNRIFAENYHTLLQLKIFLAILLHEIRGIYF